MRIAIRFGVALAIVAIFARGAGAQAPLSLSLADAISRGVAAAPSLAASRAREAAAGATVTSRGAAGAPSATASAGYLRTNHVTAFGLPQPDGTVHVLFPDIPDNYQTKAELDVPVYTAGRVGALVSSARADVRAAEADTSATEQDLRLEIASAYWTLVSARENVRVLEEAQRRMDAAVDDVRAHLNAGLAAPSDLSTAQAERAHQAVGLIQAQNAAAVAEANLDRLIGAPPGQAIAVVTSVDEPTPGSAAVSDQTLDVLVTRARTGRAERGALEARQASLEATGDAALAGHRPTVGAYAAVEPARPNMLFVPRTDQWQTSWNLGVNVSWSLWDGGKAQADHAAAAAQADATGRAIDDFDAHVAVDIRQRLLDIQSGRAAIDASNDEVSAATEALRVVQARFDAGVATTTDVVNAEVALRQAELERTGLEATLRVSEARLLRAVGAL